jgi:lysyl-tRNA synthetase class 2
MNASTGLRFLRPYLATELPITSRSAYIRFFHSTKCLGRSPVALKRVEATENIYSGVGCRKKPAANAADVAKFSPRHEVEERMKELNHSNALVYPRISSHSSGSSMSISEYTDRFKHLKVGEMQEDFIVTIRGRLVSFL